MSRITNKVCCLVRLVIFSVQEICFWRLSPCMKVVVVLSNPLQMLIRCRI